MKRCRSLKINMENIDMTLAEYVVIAKAEIDKFAEEYQKGIEETPALYPSELSEGDWGEQELASRFQ